MQVNPHRFNWRTKDLNFVCLKYLGKILLTNYSRLCTLKAAPDGLHETIDALPCFSASSNRPYNTTGNNGTFKDPSPCLWRCRRCGWARCNGWSPIPNLTGKPGTCHRISHAQEANPLSSMKDVPSRKLVLSSKPIWEAEQVVPKIFCISPWSLRWWANNNVAIGRSWAIQQPT